MLFPSLSLARSNRLWFVVIFTSILSISLFIIYFKDISVVSQSSSQFLLERTEKRNVLSTPPSLTNKIIVPSTILRTEKLTKTFKTNPVTKIVPIAPSQPNWEALRSQSKMATYSGKNIPHIIHQTWDSHHLPGIFKTWSKTWLEQNPSWEYWIWTPADIRLLLKKFYPTYLRLYERYPTMLARSDVMRYFVMHKFGGIYADLDMYDIKPLDTWADDHQCILSEETYEHPYLLNMMTRPNVMTTILLCHPGHPFYKHTQERLAQFAHITDVLHQTGPFFLDKSYMSYMEKTRAKYLGGKIPSELDIEVVHPRFFLPTFDQGQMGALTSRCASRAGLPAVIEKYCDIFMNERRQKNVPHADSYTDHRWVHVVLRSEEWKRENMFYIYDVIPAAKNVTAILNKL